MAHKALRIAIVGYGKMGKTIESLALDKGHSIVMRTDSKSPLNTQLDVLPEVDAAIEFTSPEIASRNLSLLAEHRIPTVCGSTGWLDDYEKICALYNKNKSAFLYASNFSIGVNLFFQLNKALAKLMADHSNYRASITESHHLEKKDAPSGTAVSLAEQLMDHHHGYDNWVLTDKDTGENESLPVKALREADVKGIHEVEYVSSIDKIQIRHEAFSREGFASGALMAAEWLVGKQGIYSMDDLLGF